MSQKIIEKIISGLSDKNIRFDELRKTLVFKYEIIIYWSEEDKAFIAEVPELPGCMADGATYEEALRNAETVIAEWIETAKSLGRAIPAPKGKLSYA